MDVRPGISPKLRRLIFVVFAVAVLGLALFYGFIEWSRIVDITGAGDNPGAIP